jgi:hypothetical protein
MKPKQQAIWPGGDDLPLFTGAAPHATAYSADGVLYYLPYSNAYPTGRRYGVVCFRKQGNSFSHVYRSDLAQPNLRTMKAAVKFAQELAQ